MKRWLVLAAAVSFTACNPDIPFTPDQSSKYSTAEFDPATGVVPSPNDLAFLDASGNLDTHLHVPSPPGTSDAQKEFNDDYLNLLDGFPMESTASVLFTRAIDLSGVNAGTVRVLDITNQAQPTPITTASYSVADSTNGQQFLNITPEGGTWTRGHHYAIVVIGGNTGIKGKSNETVIGSSTWALVSSDQSLVACDAGVCSAATSAIPTTEKDPAAQVAQQLAIAQQLEALRRLYAPLLNALSASGVPRADIAVLWTFRITTAAEVTFDPANRVIPFPNDILNPTGKQVALPIPDGGSPLLIQLYSGLNTLDGFSTTAPIVSENGDGVGPLLQGKLSSIQFPLGAASPINFIQVPGSSSGADAGIPLKVVACVNCAGITDTLPDGGPVLLPDGGPKPETLEIVPQVPLTERTQYAAYITTDLKDASSKNVIPTAAFALTRSSLPLVDGTGKSTVSLLTDGQAQQLEPLRAGLKPLFDTLALSGLPRKKVALGWAFTTQSTVSTLAQLHAAPTIANVPATPLWVADVTGPVIAQITPLGIPHDQIGAFWAGEIYDLFALSSGHFMPGLSDAAPRKMPFVITIPDGAQHPEPSNGYPVTIFGHGITGNKTNVYAIANTLASIGHVAIAIDEPWHGDRNTCIGFGAYLNQATHQTSFTDKNACSNPGNQSCNAAGRCQLTDRSTAAVCNFASPTSDLGCLAVGQGACAPDNKCEGTGAGFATSIPLGPGVSLPVSGWNLLNLVDFFATRDNIRQQVISHAQLARVIATAGPAGIGPTGGSTTIKLDPTKISYLGQSLGSFLGTLYTSVAPEVGDTALNVAGSDWVLNLLTSPSFASLKDAFIAGLAAQGIPKDSPTYDTFLGIGKWVLDPADPVNAGYYLTHSAKLPAPLPPNINPATRRAFVQWILDDQTVVNPGTVELVDASIGSLASDPTRIATPPFWSYQFNGSSVSGVPTCDRHPFLLVPSDGVCTSPAGPPTPAGSALTAAGQGQVATFLLGAAPF